MQKSGVGWEGPIYTSYDVFLHNQLPFGGCDAPALKFLLALIFLDSQLQIKGER